MKVGFWTPGKTYQTLKVEILEAIDRVCSAGELVMGDYGKDITRFEQRMAEYLGVKYFVMTGSGTQALFLVYKTLLKPEDEVITVSHTFIATIDQIKAVGATPVLVDIGDDGLIDPREIEKAITPKTRMIVPVHLEGKMCDMFEITRIAQKHNLLVVEDAAQALGASIVHDESPAGKVMSGSIGIAGCFSFYPAKILGSLGNAGGVATDDERLAIAVRNRGSSYRFAPLEERDWGYNLEPDNLQAAICNIKFNHLEETLAQRKEIAERYLEAFKDLRLILPPNQEGRVWQDFILRLTETWEKVEFLRHLEENGIGFLGHDLVPNHKYPLLGLNVSLPETERYIKQQVRIPCNPDLTNEEVEYVIRVICDFYAK